MGSSSPLLFHVHEYYSALSRFQTPLCGNFKHQKIKSCNVISWRYTDVTSLFSCYHSHKLHAKSTCFIIITNFFTSFLSSQLVYNLSREVAIYCCLSMGVGGVSDSYALRDELRSAASRLFELVLLCKRRLMPLLLRWGCWISCVKFSLNVFFFIRFLLYRFECCCWLVGSICFV